MKKYILFLIGLILVIFALSRYYLRDTESDFRDQVPTNLEQEIVLD